jgi:trans-aconitate methyltransferase
VLDEATIRAVKRDSKTGSRKIIKGEEWPLESTGILMLETWLDFPIREFVRNRYATRSHRPVVVDWGCGQGQGIEGIAKDIPTARCIGFSDKRYVRWNSVENVDFIHRPANDFFRFFKDGSIDFLYSHMGMEHLRDNPAYIQKLIPKLRPGGCMLFGNRVAQQLQKARILPKADIIEGHKEENEQASIQYIGDSVLILRKK